MYITESTNDNIITCFSRQTLINKDKHHLLFRIIKAKDSDNYVIKFNQKPLTSDINQLDLLWYVVNSDSNLKNNNIKNDDYILGENDVLKIGYYKYIVSKIHIQKDSKNKINRNIKPKYFDLSPPLKDVKRCKFCNELTVRLCQCEEYLHTKEIKKWVDDTKKVIKKPNSINYYFSLFYCDELKDEKNNNRCNTYYPLNFKVPPSKYSFPFPFVFPSKYSPSNFNIHL